MRPILTLLHRWFGLLIAAFIFVTGVTGAVISWDHELDDWLNPHLTHVQSAGPALPGLELARQVELRDPRVRVTYVPLAAEPGEALSVFVMPRVNPASGREHVTGYNQVFLDPVTGTELGRREWGAAWPITRATFVSFLYKLHYSLHIPQMWGTDRWGLWLLGSIAIIWMLDCFVGFYLTLPVRRDRRLTHAPAVERQLAKGWWVRWKPSWQVKASGSAYRITLDIHRAFGLWVWLLLFMLAFTGFSLALYREVFFPAMTMVSQVTPSPFETRKARAMQDQIEPQVSFEQVVQLASAEASRRGWREPVGAISYAPLYGVYGARFFAPGDDHGAAGVGPARLYYDSVSGELIGDRVPWSGTAADIFVQAQFPLHSGRILGLPGRIMISVMGLVAAALSVTGVIIWYRKRAARIRRDAKVALRGHYQPAD